MKTMERFGPLVGRTLLGLLFLVSGVGKIMSYSGTAGYMASKGMPLVQLLLPLTILLELGSGLMLVLGWRARCAAVILFLFLIPATLIFHNFWAAPPAQIQNQMNHFLKNVAIMGGMLYIIVHGSGPISASKS